MGGAMLDGWLAAGLDPLGTTIVEAQPSDAVRRLCAERGLTLNPAAVAPAAVLVLAIKPQGFSDAAPDLDRMIGPETVLLSILAGKTLADIADTPALPPRRRARDAQPARQHRPRRHGRRGQCGGDSGPARGGRCAAPRQRPRRVGRYGSRDRRGDGPLGIGAGLRLPAGRGDGGGRDRGGPRSGDRPAPGPRDGVGCRRPPRGERPARPQSFAATSPRPAARRRRPSTC